MNPKPQCQVSLCAHQAQIAVQDWLETQSRVTGYWRDLLVSSGGSEALIAMLDHHADVLATAARLDYEAIPHAH